MANHKKQFVHYDPEADAIGFYIGKGREEEFVEIAPNVAVELDARGGVVGVEIMNASKVLRPFLKLMEKRSPASAR